MPIERAACARIPNSVSVANTFFCWSHIKRIAKTEHIIIVPKFVLIPRTRPRATPSKALCAKESPKYAIFLQTTKHPIAPVIIATPIPAIIALIKNGSIILILVMRVIMRMLINRHHFRHIIPK